jgi:hypothetical protein
MTRESVAVAGAPAWTGFPGIERAVVRTLVAELLADGAATRLSPSAMFTAVCEVMVSHFSLTSAGFVKRVAGQSRSFLWSAAGTGGVGSAARIPAKAHSWTTAAELLEAASHLEEEGEIASATVADDRLGLAALLYVESRRTLDGGDRALLDNVLRRMLCLPGLDGV